MTYAQTRRPPSTGRQTRQTQVDTTTPAHQPKAKTAPNKSGLSSLSTCLQGVACQAKHHHSPDPASIKSRLSSLSTCLQGVARPPKQAKTAPAVHLELLGDGSARPFIGVHAVPNRLPEMLRYPGESAQAFAARALHHVTGVGALWAKLIYAADTHQATP